MDIHANARTCPNSRRLLVKRVEEEGWSLMVAAEAAGISERSARKWLGRWRAEGEAGLFDRSSAPKHWFATSQSANIGVIAVEIRVRSCGYTGFGILTPECRRDPGPDRVVRV